MHGLTPSSSKPIIAEETADDLKSAANAAANNLVKAANEPSTAAPDFVNR